MAAKRHIHHPIKERQSSPLVLNERREILAGSSQRVRDVNRPAWQDRTVLKRQREDAMSDAGGSFNGGVEINGLGRLIDYRGARDSQRINIAARQRRSGYRPSERAFPHFGASVGVDRVDDIVFGREENDRRL